MPHVPALLFALIVVLLCSVASLLQLFFSKDWDRIVHKLKESLSEKGN